VNKTTVLPKENQFSIISFDMIVFKIKRKKNKQVRI